MPWADRLEMDDRRLRVAAVGGLLGVQGRAQVDTGQGKGAAGGRGMYTSQQTINHAPAHS